MMVGQSGSVVWTALRILTAVSSKDFFTSEQEKLQCGTATWNWNLYGAWHEAMARSLKEKTEEVTKAHTDIALFKMQEGRLESAP